MRLIGTLSDGEEARKFSFFLAAQGIENDCETVLDPVTGEAGASIWIYDEDRVPAAEEWLQTFQADPKAAAFAAAPHPDQEADKPAPQAQKAKRAMHPKALLKKNHRLGVGTALFLGLCVALFLIQAFTQPPLPPAKSVEDLPFPVPYALFSPVQKQLLYDYPEKYELLSQLFNLYSLEEIQEPAKAPPEMRALVASIEQTPVWEGLYPQLVVALKQGAAPAQTAPLFEKIRDGQVWRVFTPCLLHADILHLFFNMIWLVVLGPQMEKRLGLGRFLALVAIAALVSNTAQYLMSGPNFLGFSGVVCAMIGFIWMRQRKAAWEGYLLHRSTILFVGFFVLAMLVLQLISFATELTSDALVPISIANTAHIAGALVGLALGSLKCFAWRPQIRP